MRVKTSTALIASRFDDCLKLGRRIDEAPYLLPNPDYVFKTGEEDIPIPPTAHMEGATSAFPTNVQVPVDSQSSRPATVFKDKTIMISEDLAIRSRIRTIIENIIEDGGGKITSSVHEADIYVCHWREGRDYVIASRARKDVGNLSWLYYLITHNEWTSPFRRLLHYPLPREPLPGFKDFRITLSNYGGDARVYLENLVQAAGADFTKSMKGDNTHLITARNGSEKCDAAKEWNVEMVNHLWIEDSYARCAAQKMTDPRYTHFPPRTNLGEVIGQTQFDVEILESMYFPSDPTPSPGDPEPITGSSSSEKNPNLPSSRTSFEDVVMGGGVPENVEPEGEEVAVKPKKSAPKPKSRSSAGPLSTPARRVSAGRENDTPSSTNSRSAKDRALNKIHVLGPDLLLYEKENKRKGPVWGGANAAKQLDKERSSSPAGNDEEDQYSADDLPKPKRAKTGSNLLPVSIRLLLTGYKGWLGAPQKEDTEKVIELVYHIHNQC